MPPCSTDSTECSPSTSTISASSVPSATNLARYSTSDDCGVMGYTATMSTPASVTPSAAASLPSQTMIFDFGLSTADMSGSLRHHGDGTMRALLGADAAALAGGEVEVEPRRFLHHALHRAVQPA